jgi:hypothetical protein
MLPLPKRKFVACQQCRHHLRSPHAPTSLTLDRQALFHGGGDINGVHDLWIVDLHGNRIVSLRHNANLDGIVMIVMIAAIVQH